jgi:diguanylate cyclase (GGDEF)-like protein/PAS domain S-box-containing protein
MSDKTLPSLNWQVVFNRAAPPDRRGWGRVRAAQLQEMSRAMTIAAWGQTLNALLIAYILSNVVPPATLAAWLVSLAVLMLVTVRYRAQLGGREIHSVSRRTLDRASYHAIFFAALWCVPARFFFEVASHEQQLALCVVTATLMAGAAFIFSPIAPAAAAYVIVMGIATTHMLGTTGSPIIQAIGPIYTCAMLMMVLLNGRAFMQRKCLDIALDERSEMVSLLLREFESSDADWLWQTNRPLVFQNVSARFARAVGRPVRELEGMTVLDLLRSVPAGDAAARRQLARLETALTRHEPVNEMVVTIETPAGTRCIELAARPRFSKQGRFLGYQGVGSDVTEARQAADRIAHMARHDALTGLPNRVQLLDHLDAALKSARAQDSGCAVLLIDLDRFKAINDTLGHVAGDHLLQQVARCFSLVVGEDMMAGRLGGDEFAVVVPRIADTREVEELALALVSALQGPFHYREQRLFVGASIGIAVGPGDGASVEELIRNADLALYRAKDGSGNEIRFYEPELHARAEERRRIEVALRTALENGEFSLAYQPVVEARSSRIAGFEALLRWKNPELGQVGPATFIPIAEDTGLVGRIGEWVLRTACTEAAGWPADVSVAVNVSPRQIEDPGFVVTLVSALTQARLEPHRLELEVTESVFLELTGQTQKVLQQIQALGVRLAMDDFGTGYSSLGYLRQAEFDTLKVDRSFVQAVSEEDPESTAIIRAVVALAGSLGMKTVAEGVATPEQLDLVRSLGCDRIQGYIFSRPVGAGAVKAMLADRTRAAA